MRIGVLCSGGDSPGMNAAIRGAVLRGVDVHGFEMLGFVDGWRGFHSGEAVQLDRATVRGISPLGGVFLGTSRVAPFARQSAENVLPEAFRARVADYGLDGFVLIGGNGTQTVSHLLTVHGVRVVGLPKTIDNDLGGTDYTFGFDTAVSIAAEAVDRLRTTGDSHRRCMMLEVMGRDAGWIALHAGMAGGAQAILIPEVPETLDQICAWVTSVHQRGRSALVVVAEGFRLAGEPASAGETENDPLGRSRLSGVTARLAPLIEQRTGIETRATVLGYVQRGAAPTAFDRVLATRTGMAAADAMMRQDWGVLAALHGDRIEMVPIAHAVNQLKQVPIERYAEARLSFG